MGQRTPTEVQKLQGFVEPGRVRTAGITDREYPVYRAQHFRINYRFTGSHPVLVTAHRIDFAIMGNHAVGVGQWPGWERVCRKTGVNHSNG